MNRRKGAQQGRKSKVEKGREDASAVDSEERALAEAFAQARVEGAERRSAAVGRAKAARRHGVLARFRDGQWDTLVLLQLRRLHRVLGLPPPSFTGDVWTYIEESTLTYDDILGFALALEATDRTTMQELLAEARAG
jgi:hypothetical protein